MRVSWAKTKLQNIGSGVHGHPSNITVDGNIVEQVDNFIYLGSTQSSNGGSQADIMRRIALASSVFSATSLEGSIPLVTDEDPGIQNASFTRSSVRLRDMDHTRCQ